MSAADRRLANQLKGIKTDEDDKDGDDDGENNNDDDDDENDNGNGGAGVGFRRDADPYDPTAPLDTFDFGPRRAPQLSIEEEYDRMQMQAAIEASRQPAQPPVPTTPIAAQRSSSPVPTLPSGTDPDLRSTPTQQAAQQQNPQTPQLPTTSAAAPETPQIDPEAMAQYQREMANFPPVPSSSDPDLRSTPPSAQQPGQTESPTRQRSASPEGDYGDLFDPDVPIPSTPPQQREASPESDYGGLFDPDAPFPSTPPQ